MRNMNNFFCSSILQLDNHRNQLIQVPSMFLLPCTSSISIFVQNIFLKSSLNLWMFVSIVFNTRAVGALS